MDNPDPFAELGDARFACIVADPPWHWRSWSKKGEGRAASNHYSVMDLASIKNLPVRDIAADDCALFLWAIDPMLPQALDLIRAWGFTYKTVGFTWAKRNLKDTGWHFGLGYWTRANPEMCLLATRGKPIRLSKSVRQLLPAPRREHSRKPDESYHRIEQLVPGPRLEMFCRERRPGWAAWGLETDKFTSEFTRTLEPPDDRLPRQPVP